MTNQQMADNALKAHWDYFDCLKRSDYAGARLARIERDLWAWLIGYDGED